MFRQKSIVNLAHITGGIVMKKNVDDLSKTKKNPLIYKFEKKILKLMKIISLVFQISAKPTFRLSFSQ